MKDNTHEFDNFSAPVPGESLTKIPGGAPFEQPPQFTDIQEASEYMFDTLVEQRQSARVITLLKHGITCEAIARTIVFTGFMQGKWTPDVALLIARPVLYMVVAVAERAKTNKLLKKYTILNPDYEQESFMSGFSMMKDMDVSEAEVDKTEDQLEDKPLGLKEEGSPEIGGLLGRGM
jgi:hypothetical protein